MPEVFIDFENEDEIDVAMEELKRIMRGGNIEQHRTVEKMEEPLPFNSPDICPAALYFPPQFEIAAYVQQDFRYANRARTAKVALKPILHLRVRTRMTPHQNRAHRWEYREGAMRGEQVRVCTACERKESRVTYGMYSDRWYWHPPEPPVVANMREAGDG